jgi:proline iminopeptidase
MSHAVERAGAARSDVPDLYPPIEPYDSGFLVVSADHTLAYEICGNPSGRPVVFLHGGPGAGCTAMHRRFFDPCAYKIVLFDQRGAGRSTPVASVVDNTTAHLVSDIESLRLHLGIERWIVFGGSWGSTLALAYAAAHPEACRALVLRGVWLCRESDIDWWFAQLRFVYPEHWADFASHIPRDERCDLLQAYLRRLLDPDPAVHRPAAAAWEKYEMSGATLLPKGNDHGLAPANALSLSRIEAHYMHHRCFMRENELLDAVPRFRHVPGVIIHGRYDMLCPVEGAFTLAAAWPEATLSIVPDAGHSATEPGIRRELVAAMDRFRNLDEGKRGSPI